MPFIPTNTECNDLLPGICGNQMKPTVDYSFTCTGCISRPYGDRLSDLLIPNECLPKCDED